MKRTSLNLMTAALLAMLMAACGKPATNDGSGTGNAIYHWRSTFAPDQAELAWLKRHDVGRIYIKMFDVAIGHDDSKGEDAPVPIATTQFAAPVPEGVEVVPTVFITLEALYDMGGQTDEYAALIVERVKAMARHNRLGRIREVQLDCDWTENSRPTYAALCSAARDRLHKDTMQLSITVRLHQLGEDAMPADRGVLMLYNTGSFKNHDTRNSILDVDDMKAYVKGKMAYGIPLDYAYPAFGWGVMFRDGYFEALVSDPDNIALDKGQELRQERASYEDIMQTKHLVEQCLGRPARGNIIYHLDKTQLKHYTDDEIDKIYAGD